MKCQKCGKRVRGKFAFCPYCGVALKKGAKDRRRDGYDDLDPYDAYDDYDDWEEEEEKSGKTSNAEVLIGTFLALALLVAWATNNIFISLGLFFLVIIVSMIGSLPH